MKTPQLVMVDAAWNRAHNACYYDSRLQALYDRPMSGMEVATRIDGPWWNVPARDRIWVIIRLFPRLQLNEWLARLVERALGRTKHPDARSLAVAGALRANTIALGILEDSLRAYDMARADNSSYIAATAYNAARVILYDALAAYADVAYVASSYATFAANSYDDTTDAIAEASLTAERNQQISDAVEILQSPVWAE